MNKLFSKLLLAAAPLLLLVPARAAIDPALVGADAQWVVYADLNGLRASTLGAQLISLAAKDPPFQATAADLRLDLPKILATIGSVTAYGTNLTHDPQRVDGTMILQGTPDLRKIAEGVPSRRRRSPRRTRCRRRPGSPFPSIWSADRS